MKRHKQLISFFLVMTYYKECSLGYKRVRQNVKWQDTEDQYCDR